MSRQYFSKAPLWPLFTSIAPRPSSDVAISARPSAMRHFGQFSSPPTPTSAVSTTTTSHRPALVALPSKIALDSFFVQHAPLNDPSLEGRPRFVTRGPNGEKTVPQNKAVQMDQLASLFGAFVPFRAPNSPSNPPQRGSKWQRMTLRGGEPQSRSEALNKTDPTRYQVLRSVFEEAEQEAEELKMAREVIQAARLWVNIKKIRHQKIKKHKLQKLRKRDRILRKQK